MHRSVPSSLGWLICLLWLPLIARPAEGASSKLTPQQIRQEAGKLYAQARQFEQKGNAGYAVRLYNKLAEKYPQTWQARDALQQVISTYTRRWRNTKAANKARQRFIELFPDDDRCPQYQFEIAETLASGYSRDAKSAVAEYRKLVDKYPESDKCGTALFKIGQCSHSYLRDHAGAEKAYRELLQKYPEDDNCPEAQFNLARYVLQYGLKNSEGARAEYEQFVKKYPTNDRVPSVMRSLAQTYTGLKQYQKAEALYRKLLATYPKSSSRASWQNSLAYLCYGYQANYQQATKEYEKLVTEYPKSSLTPMGYYYLTWGYYYVRDYENARKSAQTGLKKHFHSVAAPQLEQALESLPEPQ